MTKHIFVLCVDLLEWAAKKLGTTYVAINVWIFCVIWPLFTLALIAVIVFQQMKIAELMAR